MEIKMSQDALEELNSTEAKALYNIVDDLSSCGVGKIVDLPQIIVVGKQSVGKSSVLEAISRVRFPIKDGVCTRFATELVLRQSKIPRVDVSVKYDSDATSNNRKPDEVFRRSGFNAEDLPDIIKEAKEKIGLASADNKEFSKDVLRIEIEGEDLYPLTLVDLPGLYNTPTEKQSMKGTQVVDEIVKSYMKRKNTIILVVVAARDELADQFALTTVQKFDKDRKRTIGVITKPDLSTSAAEAKTYIQLAKNQEKTHTLKLGWHVMKNQALRSRDDDLVEEGDDSTSADNNSELKDNANLDDRDTAEEHFFASGLYSSIPVADRGVSRLRKKLSRVLYNHIRHSLPGVIEDIERKLEAHRDELNSLGEDLSEISQKRAYLVDLAVKFQHLVREGLYGNYKDRAFFGDLDEKEHKLRARVRNLNRAFDYALKIKGTSQVIVRDSHTPNSEDAAYKQLKVPSHLVECIKDLYAQFAYPKAVHVDKLNEELQYKAAANQGHEFPGCPKEGLIVQLFQEQARPWQKMCAFHVQRMTDVAKAFVDQVFKHTIKSEMILEAMLKEYVDMHFDMKTDLLTAKLKELLRPYEEGFAVPLDTDFLTSMSMRTTQQLTDQIWSKLEGDSEAANNTPFAKAVDKQNDNSTRMVQKSSVEDAVSKVNNPGDFGTDKVIDMMETFYEMSRRTLTDNVINHAIESCLLHDLTEIFTPQKVYGLSDERVLALATESEDTTARRRQLKDQESTLKKALALCREYRPRSVAPAFDKPDSMSDVPLPLVKGDTGVFKSLPSTTKKSSESSFSFPTDTKSATSNIFTLNGVPFPNTQPEPAVGGLFGGNSSILDSSTKATTSPASGLFGATRASNTTPATTPARGLFGATRVSNTTPATSPAGGGLFGSSAKTSPFGSSTGAGSPASKPLLNSEKELTREEVEELFELEKIGYFTDSEPFTVPKATLLYTHISFIQGYKHLSPEELRLDYLRVVAAQNQ